MVKSFPKPFISLFPKPYNKKDCFQTTSKLSQAKQLQKQTFRNLNYIGPLQVPQLVFTCYTETSTLQRHFLAASLPECFCLWLEASVHMHLICYILFQRSRAIIFQDCRCGGSFQDTKTCPFPKAATFSKAATSWISCW